MKSTISPAPRPPSITSTIPSRPRKPAYTARSTCWAWRSERKRKFFRHPRAQADGVDVAPVVLRLGMDGGVAIDFARGCLKNFRFRSLRQAQHVDRAVYAGFRGLDGIVLVMDEIG